MKSIGLDPSQCEFSDDEDEKFYPILLSQPSITDEFPDPCKSIKCARDNTCQTTVFKRQIQLHSDFSHLEVGPEILALIPSELQNIQSLDVFKDKLKKIKFEQCPCNICRVYVDGVGYID